MRRNFLALLLPFSLLFPACEGDGGKGGAATHPIRGKVVSVDPAARTVVLDHEEIPGVMGAMTMPFRLEDPRIVEGLKPADAVEGRLLVKDGAYIITELKKR